MKGLTVLTTLRYEGAHWEGFIDALKGAEILRFESPQSEGFDAALARADVAILAKDPDVRILSAPRLRWIHVDHAGLNRAARPEAFREGLVVTGSAGRSAPVLAEHALFFSLALAYRYPAFLDAQRAHQWGVPGQDDLRGLYGRTMGIVGLGNTGKELALRGRAFGMRVLGYRRRSTEPPPGVDQLFSAEAGEGLDPLLEQSDFVVLALGLSDKTHHMIGRRELRLIGPKGYLINMARGPVVDEAALVAALHAGEIAGAGLDTFEVEPLPKDSPVWDAPNTLITPHVTPAVPDRTGRSLDIIRENIRRFSAGEAMLNVLTPEDRYTRA
ncbi:hydroxyacid dehydrogenase [Novosphingobium endophyticum]|uniref:Hydroxyacid dehydrogenase n=1 Tax=Novosphingobium endophyticum TaxID=1955250 RepID=A0A916X7E4_9SPHN|nr:D-2-hydroxyacid dehydrogenase [Novosphingobium endophyticum]GGC13437.1 hydroxyacid dehydrogenase [Novosphingobium endophyticum]